MSASPSPAEQTILSAFGQGMAAAGGGGYLSDNPHPWDTERWQAWREGFALIADPARRTVVTIDTASAPGAWRSTLGGAITCAACRQSECDYPDLIYQGLVPLPAHP